MSKNERLLRKVEQIEKLLVELKTELQEEQQKLKLKTAEDKAEMPPAEIMVAEYEKLYEDFSKGSIQPIEDFNASKTKTYLKASFKANILSSELLRKSKAKDGLVQSMVQRKAITKKAT